jgi:ribonuclease HII
MLWVIGIDEAGRGPLAGPISVGAVAIPIEKNNWKFWQGLKDSKQLSAQQRSLWFQKIKEADILHAVAMVGARIIDKKGIVYAAQIAVTRSIHRLHISSKEAAVLLDWGLSAPDIWEQERFKKGDERIPAIALASIVAKVTRDHHMTRLAKKFPEYHFERHKGYGTRAHYDALARHGSCNIHRRTFL